MVRAATLLVVLGLCRSGAAQAQDAEADVVLDWAAPATCPSGAEVRAQTLRLLGGKPRPLPGGTPRIRARVEAGLAWRVVIESGAGPTLRRRLLEANSCAGLADATALIVALMIDPDAVAAARPGPSPAPAPPSPPEPAQPARRATRLALAVLGVSHLGILPSLDLGAGASLAIVRAAWRFELQASYGFRRDQSVAAPAPSGAYGTFDYFGGDLGACRIFAGRRVIAGPCADVEVGVLSARGHGVTQGLTGNAPWLGMGAGGYVAVVASHRLSFPLRAGLLLPLTRPEFVIVNVQGRVYREPPLAARASLGAELCF